MQSKGTFFSNAYFDATDYKYHAIPNAFFTCLAELQKIHLDLGDLVGLVSIVSIQSDFECDRHRVITKVTLETLMSLGLRQFQTGYCR